MLYDICTISVILRELQLVNYLVNKHRNFRKITSDSLHYFHNICSEIQGEARFSRIHSTPIEVYSLDGAHI